MHDNRFVRRRGWPLAAVALIVAGVAALSASAQERETVEAESPLPHVRVIGTGGTIAAVGSLDSYESGALLVEDLVEAVPPLAEVAEITSEQFSNTGSTGITPAMWLQLAQRINTVLTEGVDGRPVDGVVVTHGTDALEETAYFLNLTVRSDKPVVVVGSMRPATGISADGPLNLLNAVQVAASDQARGHGVLVVLNQEINAARDATKTNAQRVQTFQSRVWGALGSVEAEGPVFRRRVLTRHTIDSEIDISALTPDELPRVDIAYNYNGADGTAVRAFTAAGAEGIVLAISGAGGGVRGPMTAAGEAREAGVFIAMTTRSGAGQIHGSGLQPTRDGYLDGVDLTPQKARILLMLALTQTRNLDELQRIFRTY